jgi:hypothetical protein
VEPVTWYWRLLALLSSWIILGGYLIFPAAYDSDPKLRYSDSLLYAVIATLLAAGYCSTILLSFSCDNVSFRTESVFLPSLASSALGLLTLLYQFASSSRYTWNAAATIAAVVSTCATLLFAVLLFWTHRRETNPKVTVETPYKLDLSAPSTYITSPYPSDQQCQPHRQYSSYGAESHPPSTHNRVSTTSIPTEDELVSHQMAMLLSKRDSGASQGIDQHTFKIDLPNSGDSRPGTPDGDTLKRMFAIEVPHDQSLSEIVQPLPHSPREKRFHGLGIWDRVGQTQARAREHEKPTTTEPTPMERVKRREDRRREIERGRPGDM